MDANIAGKVLIVAPFPHANEQPCIQLCQQQLSSCFPLDTHVWLLYLYKQILNYAVSIARMFSLNKYDAYTLVILL